MSEELCDPAKEKGRQFGGLKVWFEEDPSPKNNLEKHVGMVGSLIWIKP